MKNRIKELRHQQKITQSVLAKYLGVAQNTLSYWENGKFDIDNASLQKIADFFGCSTDHILLRDDSNVRPALIDVLTTASKIPVLGKVPAGVPIEAIEDVIDEIEIGTRMANDGYDYFALLVSGNSMYPEYIDGDVVIVRCQDSADTGDDVIAYVNGYDATLKRLVRSSKGITLRPLNPEYETRTFTDDEVRSLPVRIAGVVVEQRRSRK